MKNMFQGIRFYLAGFDPASGAQYRSELVNGGAVDVGRYDSSCTHVIVHNLVHDDPVCIVARSDGKILITNLWVEDSLDTGSLADASRILYSPVKDLRGISGAESLYICLTGYQRKDRDDIMKMVALMGAQFSKPLIAAKVTHLICYKFEGEKYELAKKTKIKLVNHQWLEDCLKAWEILPVDRYDKSSWELEVMEAEARDSEDEMEMRTSGFSGAGSCLLTPHRLGLSKLVKEVSKSPENAIAVKRSLHNSENIFSNNKLLSTPDKVANSGRAAIIDESKINVQESGHQSEVTQPQTGKDGILKDANIDRVISILSDKSSNLTNEASKPSSATIAVGGSPHPDASNGKFYKLSFSRKASRKTAFSMVSDLSDYLHSSPQAQSELKKVKDVSSNSPSSLKKAKSNFSSGEIRSLKTAKNNLSSGEIQSTGAEIEMKYAEGQETMPQKSKDALCRAGFSCMDTSVANPFTTARSSDSESAPAANDALQLDYLPGNDKNCLNFISKDSASNQPTETARLKASSLGSKPLKCSPPCLKTGTCNDAVLSSDGKVTNLPYDIEPKHVLGKPMDVNNTTNCLGVTATENRRVADTEAKNYLGAMAIDTGNMVDTSSQEKKPEESLRYSNTSKLDNRPDNSDVTKRTLANHQESEIGAVWELQHDWDVSPSKRRKCENDKFKTTTNTNMVKGGNDRAPSGRPGKIKAKKKVNPTPKLDTGNPCKGKGSVFLGKADTSNKATLCSENSRDLPNAEKAAGNEMNDTTGSASEGEVVIEKEKGPSLPLNKTENVTVVEALIDAEKENKPVATTGQSRNLAKRINKKGAFNSNRISMQSKETVTGSNSDELQASRCSVPSSSEPIWFMLSGHRLQRKEFQQVVRHLRGRICRDSHQWSYRATHLIFLDPIRRTEKFFAAASAGRWILKKDYLTASSQAGRFLAEEPFEWHKSGLSEDGAINLEAPRKWRLLRERTGHGAFHGMQIVIYGNCIAPSLDTLKRVVKAGGGSILATSPPYNRFLKSGFEFAVISPGTSSVDCWVQDFLRHEIPCIVADYLVEYVCKPGCSLDRHVLFNTHAWAEKSFARMSARLEDVVEPGTPKQEHGEVHGSATGK